MSASDRHGVISVFYNNSLLKRHRTAEKVDDDIRHIAWLRFESQQLAIAVRSKNVLKISDAFRWTINETIM